MYLKKIMKKIRWFIRTLKKKNLETHDCNIKKYVFFFDKLVCVVNKYNNIIEKL